MISDVVSYSIQAMKNYRLSPAELKQLQTRKLRQMVRYCYNYVPLYRGWFRERGLTPEDIRETKDLRLLPTLSRENLSSSASVVVPNARVGIVKSSSGTTGKPLKIFWSPDFIHMMTGLVFRKTWMMGVRPWHTVANIWTGSSWEPIINYGTARKGLVYTYKLLFGSISLWILAFNQNDLFVSKDNWKTIASALNYIQPDVIQTRPSHARRLGQILRESGQRVNPKLLMAQGEFMSLSTRSDIASLYNCDVFDNYGSTEFGALGFECPKHSGIHLDADCFIFEVERDGEPISPGESGEMIISSLHNDAMPLLRYEQGDRVTLEEEGRCSCGSYLPRLRAIHGRLSDGLRTTDGENIPSSVICDQLERVFGIRGYQLIQKSSDRITMKLLCTYNTKQTADSVARYMIELLGGSPTVELEEWSEDDMPAKYRPVISEINQ